MVSSMHRYPSIPDSDLLTAYIPPALVALGSFALALFKFTPTELRPALATLILEPLFHSKLGTGASAAEVTPQANEID